VPIDPARLWQGSPHQFTQRRNGNPGPLDAESAARAVQSGRASGIPKSRDAQVEMIAVLRVARRGAMKTRIRAGAQIDAIIISAPASPCLAAQA
jgi:transposase